MGITLIYLNCPVLPKNCAGLHPGEHGRRRLAQATDGTALHQSTGIRPLVHDREASVHGRHFRAAARAGQQAGFGSDHQPYPGHAQLRPGTFNFCSFVATVFCGGLVRLYTVRAEGDGVASLSDNRFSRFYYVVLKVDIGIGLDTIDTH